MSGEGQGEEEKQEIVWIAVHDHENLSDEKLIEILRYSDGYAFDPQGRLFIAKKMESHERPEPRRFFKRITQKARRQGS